MNLSLIHYSPHDLHCASLGIQFKRSFVREAFMVEMVSTGCNLAVGVRRTYIWPQFNPISGPNLQIQSSCERMCCSFYLYLPIILSVLTGYSSIGTTFVGSEVPDIRQNQIQQTKLHHFFYITLLNLQHILFLFRTYGSFTHYDYLLKHLEQEMQLRMQPPMTETYIYLCCSFCKN